MVNAKRVFPADVYDTLDFSALVFGGIGAGRVFPWDAVRLAVDEDVPWCLVGHAIVGADQDANNNPLLVATREAGVDVLDNDQAVRRINERKGVALDARVPFDEWCAELNIVRGDS